MAKLQLSFACGLYDRMQPLYTGEVKAEGIDLNFIAIDQPRPIFDRMAGGDLDADWEDVNETGSEAVGGDSPTPDQSIVEENARAIGVSFEDNEELDFLDKIERRDRDRYELEEQSKTRDDTI